MTIFGRVRRARRTVKVSVNSRGEGRELASVLSAISGARRWWPFASYSTHLGVGDDNTAKDVFVNDRRDRDDGGRG